MKNQISADLKVVIDKYVNGTYSESDFHSSLNSLIGMITESGLIDLREFLESQEGELERIDFLVDAANQRQEYERIIKNIQSFTGNWNCF